MGPDVFDLGIVGAGPAGMAAAVAAAAQGLRVVVADEQPRPGGQILRQLPAGLGGPAAAPAGYPWGPGLLRAAERAPVTWQFGTTVVGALREEIADGVIFRLLVTGPGGTRSVHARRLLIATGAFDLPVAFPGWTVPGVVMAGAAQTLLKSQRLLVAQRLVLAGAHPLLILVADQLRAEGAEVLEVALAQGMPTPMDLVRALPGVPGHREILRSAVAALSRLVRAGVRISTRTLVTEVSGTDHVEAVTLAPVDRQWRVHGPHRRIPAEAVVLGYGFQPSTELARQVGCRMRWDSPAGGWVVAHEESMRTSVPGVYVAGEPAGVAGANQSRAQGHRAGLAVVADLREVARARREVARARREVARATRFSRVVQRMFAPNRDALAELATGPTVVCRCELVTRSDIDQTMADHPHVLSASALKLQCRSGMGLCQGRYCEGTVAALLARERDLPMPQVGHFAAHLPVKPVPVASLALTDEVGPAGAPGSPCAHPGAGSCAGASQPRTQ